MSEELTTLGDIAPSLTRPISIPQDDRRGTETISVDEIRLPRLCHAQGLSPQMTPGDGQYIEDLKMFDMFNDLTGEVYGKGPLAFVPLRRDVRYIEFRPRSEGGGLVDLNVQRGDDRLEWRRGEGQNGEDLPPRATEFIEFVVLLLRKNKAPEPIVLSIKTTNKDSRRAADKLTTLIKMRPGPIFSGIYTVVGGTGKNDKGTYGVPVINDAGWIPKDASAGAKLYTYAEQFAASLEGKTIAVDREPGSDDIAFEEPVATTDM